MVKNLASIILPKITTVNLGNPILPLTLNSHVPRNKYSIILFFRGCWYLCFYKGFQRLTRFSSLNGQQMVSCFSYEPNYSITFLFRGSDFRFKRFYFDFDTGLCPCYFVYLRADRIIDGFDWFYTLQSFRDINVVIMDLSDLCDCSVDPFRKDRVSSSLICTPVYLFCHY